jgi:hypothetical protein
LVNLYSPWSDINTVSPPKPGDHIEFIGYDKQADKHTIYATTVVQCSWDFIRKEFLATMYRTADHGIGNWTKFKQQHPEQSMEVDVLAKQWYAEMDIFVWRYFSSVHIRPEHSRGHTIVDNELFYHNWLPVAWRSVPIAVRLLETPSIAPLLNHPKLAPIMIQDKALVDVVLKRWQADIDAFTYRVARTVQFVHGEPLIHPEGSRIVHVSDIKTPYPGIA